MVESSFETSATGRTMAKGRSLSQFREMFPDEASCAAFLSKRRWPGGFVCPRCGGQRMDTLLTDGHASYSRLTEYRRDPRIVGKMAGHRQNETILERASRRSGERRVAARRRAECDRIARRQPPAIAIINRSTQRIRYI